MARSPYTPGRYAFRQAIKQWNRLAKSGHQVVNEEAFRQECRDAHFVTGRRQIEMGRHESKSGNPELIWF